ncbi:hypothetical protein ACOZD1_22700, partial [Streptomyces rhizosphaericola]
MNVSGAKVSGAGASGVGAPGGAEAPRFAVVGNPENRRVAFFEEAVRAAGLPPARVVPWLQVLGGGAAFEPGETVRIDSPGENAEVERLLRGGVDPDPGVGWAPG